MLSLRVAAAGAVFVLVSIGVYVAIERTHSGTSGSGVRSVDSGPKKLATSSRPIPARQTIEPGLSISKEITSVEEWNKRFRESADYSAFVKAALPAALSGDGRAAFYIGAAVERCAAVMKAFRGSADPEAQLDEELSNMPNGPNWAKDRVANQMRKCFGLAKDDAFRGLPAIPGGYNSSYWYGQAVESGDPLGEVHAAADKISFISVSSNLPQETVKENLNAAQIDIDEVVRAGDLEAIFKAGALVANSGFSSSPLDGLAVTVAACELGRDCSANNPENAFAVCRESGACPADANYQYYLQQSLGPELYAQAYARAQVLKQAIQDKNWDVVADSLKLDRLNRQTPAAGR